MNSSYIYAETAFHHQGDKAYLKQLISEVTATGCNGIKFQVLTQPNDFLSSKHSAYKELASYCFTIGEWREIFSYTKELNLDIILMPLNLEALELVSDFSIKYIDIHSVSFYDSALLNAIKQIPVDIILGIGGRTLDEIYSTIHYFGNQLKVLMTGFQSFPSALEDIGMAKISVLKTLFPDLRIGYADHSSFDSEHAITSNSYARILGATIFEKHVTLNEGVNRVDYSSAVSIEKLKRIIADINFLDTKILTDFRSMEMNEKEKTYRNRQLSVVAKKDLPVGHIIGDDDVALKMIDKSDLFYRKEHMIGKKLIKAIEADEPFTTESIH